MSRLWCTIMGIIDDVVDSDMESLISDLQILIRQPSISAKKQGLDKCAKTIQQMMTKVGINSEILYLNEKKDVPPVVYGEVRSKSNPNAKTILFYNHYDVQPAEPIELWETDPFSGKVDGNYIFGRGAADDKGELITRIKAVEYFLKKTGDVPCNIKFLIEGEEEVGSANLEEYLRLYQKRFECDIVIWESGTIDEKDRPIIELGLKGILSVEIISNGPTMDVHSSLAVLIKNPAWTLIRALYTLCDTNENILIKDWYNEVRDFTDTELDALANEPFDEQEFKKEYGVDKFINDLKDIEAKKALAGNSTCNITGLISGYVGEGINNIIPSRAIAKLDFRLVPCMVPEKQFERIKNHLKEKGFDNIQVRFLDGEAPSRTPIGHPFVSLIKEAAEEIFGTSIISISSAGTGPMCYFDKILAVPSICIGGPYKYCRAHSPNEFTKIDLLNKTTKCMGKIMMKVGNII